MDSEKYNRIVEKCNLQLVKIQELEKKINEQNDYIKSIEKNKQQETSKKFLDIVIAFYSMIDNAIRNNQFLEVKKRTKINSEYSAINYNDVKRFIEYNYKNIDIKIVLKWWKELGLLLVNEKNGSCKLNYTFQGKTITCIKIKNSIINMVKISILEELNA